jgi:hypothetical protein
MSALFIPAAILTAAIQLAAAAPWVDPDTHAASTGREARVPDTFGSSDISDWYAPDNESIVINTYSHGRFKGRFMNSCQGIRFAETLGFSTKGPYELDASTNIVLPDGSRCALRELVPYSEEEFKREREERRKGKKSEVRETPPASTN